MKNNKVKIRGYGFTLVETLISIAIFAIVSVIIYLFFMAGVGSWGIGTTQVDLQAQARHAMDFMVGELKNTTRNHATRGITILPAPNNTEITFFLPDTDVNGDVVIDANGDIKWPDSDADFIKYEYLPDSDQLVRREGGTFSVLANGVAAVEFIDAGIDGSLYLDEVNITLALQKATPRQRDLSFAMASTVKLRN